MLDGPGEPKRLLAQWIAAYSDARDAKKFRPPRTE
jgi:hypothetical protein